jgi:hypothetical protein
MSMSALLSALRGEDYIEAPSPEPKVVEPRTCYVSNLVSRSDRG